MEYHLTIARLISRPLRQRKECPSQGG